MPRPVDKNSFRELLCQEMTKARDALNRARDGVPAQLKETDLLGHTTDQLESAAASIEKAKKMIVDHVSKEEDPDEGPAPHADEGEHPNPSAASHAPPPPRKPVPHPHKKH